MATIQSPFPREGDGPSAMHRSAVASEKALGITWNLPNRERSDAKSATNSLYRCAEINVDLHRYGNEVAWWANLQISPTEVWQTTLLEPVPSLVRWALRGPAGGGNHAADLAHRES